MICSNLNNISFIKMMLSKNFKNNNGIIEWMEICEKKELK